MVDVLLAGRYYTGVVITDDDDDGIMYRYAMPCHAGACMPVGAVVLLLVSSSSSFAALLYIFCCCTRARARLLRTPPRSRALFVLVHLPVTTRAVRRTSFVHVAVHLR